MFSYRHGEPRRGVAIQGRSHRPLDGHVAALLAMTAAGMSCQQRNWAYEAVSP